MRQLKMPTAQKKIACSLVLALMWAIVVASACAGETDREQADQPEATKKSFAAPTTPSANEEAVTASGLATKKPGKAGVREADTVPATPTQKLMTVPAAGEATASVATTKLGARPQKRPTQKSSKQSGSGGKETAAKRSRVQSPRSGDGVASKKTASPTASARKKAVPASGLTTKKPNETDVSKADTMPAERSQKLATVSAASEATAPVKSSEPDANPQRMSTVQGRSSLAVRESFGVPDEIAKQAKEFFDRGASFYIYAEKNEVWHGRGAVEGRIRYLKSPESHHESVKAYAFTEGRGVYGERRRFGLFCDPGSSANAQGEVRVAYNGVRRNSSMFHVTVMTLSGRAMLHVVLYPGDLNSRATRNGLPDGFISNELLIPIEF